MFLAAASLFIVRFLDRSEWQGAEAARNTGLLRRSKCHELRHGRCKRARGLVTTSMSNAIGR
jgi:hypothetical protein